MTKMLLTASMASVMQTSLAIVGCLTLLLFLAHSVFGERMVLRRLMGWDGRGADGGRVLSDRQRRVLWASWHLVTVFGLGFAALLAMASRSGSFAGAQAILAVTFLTAALYWLWATRARHPAWIVLILIGVLTGWGAL